MDNYNKGLELEKLVAELFKAKGYEVKHNVKMVGRSGVEHQVDVYAEYKAPLHTSKIIIECKSHDSPINKDIVMKLIYEVQDLGVDRGILVTTSYFTFDAISTAKGYNIDLWDASKLKELIKGLKIGEIPSNAFYVRPIIRVEEAINKVNKNIMGFLGKRGIIQSCYIIYYPYYELYIDAIVYETKGLIARKIEEKIVSTSVLFDSITGDLCSYTHGFGMNRLLRIPKLSDDETRTLQILKTDL